MLRHSRLSLFLFLCAAFSASGCAKIGDPLPPVRIGSGALQDFRVIQTPVSTQLAFRLEPDSGAQAVEIHRHCERSHASHRSEPNPLTTIPLDRLETVGATGVLAWQDARPDDVPCAYAMRLVGPTGARSQLSAVVHTTSLAPANPPRGLAAEVAADAIVVRWLPPLQNVDGSAPAHIEGYLVNLEVFVKETEYRIGRTDLDQPLDIQVQTVSRVGNPLVLSEPAVLQIGREGRDSP